jgi:hypothetical protein
MDEIDPSFDRDKIIKPPQSKVILNKNSEFLEIIIFSAKFASPSIYFGLFLTICFATTWFPMLLIQHNQIISPTTSVTSGLIYLFLIVINLYSSLMAFFGEKIFHIERDRIILMWKLFGVIIWQVSSFRKNIFRLEFLRMRKISSSGYSLTIWARKKITNFLMFNFL